MVIVDSEPCLCRSRTAAELSHELGELIRPELPSRYVLDFAGVRSLSSTAFGGLLSFILKVRHVGGDVAICNMEEFVRVGADIIRIGDFAVFGADRRSAIAAVIQEPA